MANKPTPQQEQAINDRGGKLLVSAAAGSGKTKVLVDRLIRYLKDPVSPANIDDFLIITYTKAAAAELRGKIAAKLNEEVAENPGNRHLQRQLQRLYLTKISTVHAFCADILKENAYQLSIPVDFRIAEENECQQLQTEVIERLLEDAYTNEPSDSDFYALVDSQGIGRNDRQLSELVIKLFNSARCHKNPDQWLNECYGAFDIKSVSEISNCVWVRYLIEDLHTYLEMNIQALNKCISEISDSNGMEKPCALLQDTVAQLQKLCACNDWDDIVNNNEINFGTLSFPRKNVDTDLIAKVKAIRDACKKGVQKKLRRFTDNSEQVVADITANRSGVSGLITLTRKFETEYRKVKRQRHVLDFGDLEHYALDLLVGKQRLGPTVLATELGDRFREVLVDEYQDSNEVQDAIFSAITEKKQNCFMVGDVKQSIYQFRLADPKIFLDKYNRYVPASQAVVGEGRKILLGQNFRSCGGVINAVNDVFSLCMSQRVGDLDYGTDEMLYEGIAHAPSPDPAVEVYGVVSGENVYEEEAVFVASRVAELLDGNHFVGEGDAKRPISPEDIAILLRSPGSVGEHYMRALASVGVRCSSGTADNLFETEEIQTLRSILQTVDNPLQDIPLIATLSSKVFCFTSDDLAAIRSGYPNGCMFEALRHHHSQKTEAFLQILSVLRMTARSSNLKGLMREIFAATRIDNVFGAFSDGEARIENLHYLYKLAESFDVGGGKNLNRFLNYLDSLEEKGLAGVATQSVPGAVTLMSIHKSKGLEFPVVILPGLSRSFNNESAYDTLLCDKELGIGVNCVDKNARIRYPSIAKWAISTKMLADGLSEEMRILYVAMTRAKERLIMVYTSKRLEAEIEELALRMEFSDPVLISKEADCPGWWILFAALHRIESGSLFNGATNIHRKVSDRPWHIKLIDQIKDPSLIPNDDRCINNKVISTEVIKRLSSTLDFSYSYEPATHTPSKQTATQLKGREKDTEAAEQSQQKNSYRKTFRKPSFAVETTSGATRGTAIHTAMQYLNFASCGTAEGVNTELGQLCQEGLISKEQLEMIDSAKIVAFFHTDLGKRIAEDINVIREFKFSVLEDASLFDDDVNGEQVLLQGVVDCALIEDDGIIVVDFKSDRVTEETLMRAVNQYKLQVTAYAGALEKIYKKPVKDKYLYFFELNQFVSV